MAGVSEIQLEANRENAKRSTGPRSENGKEKSSRNAMKFGIFSNQVLLPGEDAAAYESFRDGMYRRLQPLDELERMLADRVVLAAWKLRRVQAAEAARYGQCRTDGSDWGRVDGKLLKVPPTPGTVVSRNQDTFERFAKYEASLERSMYRAMAELRKVQAERGEDDVEDVEEAADDADAGGKNEAISEPNEPAPAGGVVCENEPISPLMPSPGSPEEGRGEGDFGVEVARQSKSPSSWPSPGAAGEGTREGNDKAPRRRPPGFGEVSL